MVSNLFVLSEKDKYHISFVDENIVGIGLMKRKISAMLKEDIENDKLIRHCDRQAFRRHKH